jgi:hypothetical protein
MATGFDSVLNRLAARDLILPYLESAMLADNWPKSYTIEVDSSEYYGRGDGYFHPSTHPLMGERELYYRFHPDTADQMAWERPSVQREMTLAVRSAMHGVVGTQFTMAELCKDVIYPPAPGFLHLPRDPAKGPDSIEYEYINEEHKVRGRIDWVVELPNGQLIPVEMKGRTHFKYSKETDALPPWKAQLNLGMDALGLDLGVVLMQQDGYPYHMREFPVKRDRLLLNEIYAKFDRTRDAIARNEPPRFCCAEGSTEMKSCAARFVCWLKDAPVRGRP